MNTMQTFPHLENMIVSVSGEMKFEKARQTSSHEGLDSSFSFLSTNK